MERQGFVGEAAPELRRLQDNVIRAVNPIASVPTLSGVLVGPVSIGTSFAPVNHGLGRQYQGWQVVRINANATVWEDFAWSGQTRSISMQASAACTVYLWVF